MHLMSQIQAQIILETPNYRCVRRMDANHGYPVYVFEARIQNALGEDNWMPQLTFTMHPSANFEGHMTLPVEMMVEIFRRLDIEVKKDQMPNLPPRTSDEKLLGRTGRGHFSLRIPHYPEGYDDEDKGE